MCAYYKISEKYLTIYKKYDKNTIIKIKLFTVKPHLTKKVNK